MCSLERNFSVQPKQSRGFTLLEVVVALVLVGFGLTLAFSAMSGSMRLTQKAFEHEAAMLLARAKLDEVVASPDYEIAEDLQRDTYGGGEYGFKIEVRPLPLVGPAYRDKVNFPFGLDEITINVYWGPQGATQSYSLTAYRYSSKQPGQGGTAASPAAGTSGAASGQNTQQGARP